MLFAGMPPGAVAIPGCPAARFWPPCCISSSCLLTLASRDFNSSTESCSDCTWPESWSILPPLSAFTPCIRFCKSATAAFILLTLSELCSIRFRMTPMFMSIDCCMRATWSCSACTCVCSWIMSLLAPEAGRPMPSTIAAIAIQGRVLRFRIESSVWLLRHEGSGGRAGPSPCGPPIRSLRLIDEVGPPVLLPTGFRAFRAERLFLAVADRTDAVGWYSHRHQRLFGGVCAIVAQRQVVLGGTAFVAVPFDGETNVRVLLQELRIGLQHTLILLRDVVAVVLEEDILHILREHLRLGPVALLWRRRRGSGVHCKAS